MRAGRKLPSLPVAWSLARATPDKPTPGQQPARDQASAIGLMSPPARASGHRPPRLLLVACASSCHLLAASGTVTTPDRRAWVLCCCCWWSSSSWRLGAFGGCYGLGCPMPYRGSKSRTNRQSKLQPEWHSGQCTVWRSFRGAADGTTRASLPSLSAPDTFEERRRSLRQASS